MAKYSKEFKEEALKSSDEIEVKKQPGNWAAILYVGRLSKAPQIEENLRNKFHGRRISN